MATGRRPSEPRSELTEIALGPLVKPDEDLSRRRRDLFVVPMCLFRHGRWLFERFWIKARYGKGFPVARLPRNISPRAPERCNLNGRSRLVACAISLYIASGISV